MPHFPYRVSLFIAALGLIMHSAHAQDWPGFDTDTHPHHVLSAGDAKALIMLPDMKTGYYRAKRFDHSGMVVQLKKGEHTFFAPIKPKATPIKHDRGSGTMEEFGMDDAPGWDGPEGGTVLKIGVGLIKKGKKPYKFHHRNTLINTFPWKIEKAADRISYHQVVTPEEAAGWGYDFKKVVSLTDDTLTIRHELKNTGTKPIKTTWYTHQMLKFDDKPIGKGYVYEVPYPIDLTISTKRKAWVEVTEKSIAFTVDAFKNAFWVGVAGHKTADDNQVTLRNADTGTALTITGDWVMHENVIYAETPAFCPEPFNLIDLAPDKSTSWSLSYKMSVK